MTDTRPIIELARNNAGDPHIGVTEFDPDTGLGTRTYVLSSGRGTTVANRIWEKRLADLANLVGDRAIARIDDTWNHAVLDRAARDAIQQVWPEVRVPLIFPVYLDEQDAATIVDYVADAITVETDAWHDGDPYDHDLVHEAAEAVFTALNDPSYRPTPVASHMRSAA